MKKTILFLLFIATTAIIISSCAATKQGNCPTNNKNFFKQQ